MDDMKAAIAPKSDQLNADDLITGPITITITAINIKSGEQPISVHYEGDNGKPYKCCKSMARVMVAAWGADSKKYVGRTMTLYRDPEVKWAGMAVGGIRISHMSDIESKMTMALTASKGSRKPYIVLPLARTKEPAPRADSAESVSKPALPKTVDTTGVGPDEEFDALLIKAREWAECGTEKYAAWWNGLTKQQRTHIGPERHEEFKKIAAAI